MMDNGMMSGMSGGLILLWVLLLLALIALAVIGAVWLAQHAPSKWGIELCRSAFGRSC